MRDNEQTFLDQLQATQSQQSAQPVVRVAEEPTVEVETVDADATHPQEGKEPAEHAVTATNLFRHHAAHPCVLDLVLLQRYGPVWMVWEPETLERYINQDFRGGLSDLNMTKLQAVKTLHFVDTFWQQWEVFNPCLQALNGAFPDFEIVRPPTVAQCAVAVDMARQIRDDVDWTYEVKTFISIAFRHDGLFCPVEPLDFVTVDVAELPIDRAEIMRLWPAVRATRVPPSGDSVTAEQLRRMLVVHTYLEEYRERLTRQLPLARYA